MLWLRLPWSAFSVVRGYAPQEVFAIFLRMDIPELIAMGDRRDMLEYGRRFYPMQSRAEQGMVAIKWPAPLITVSDAGEDYLYGVLHAGGHLLGELVVGGKTFWAYDFPVEINEFLTGEKEIEVEEGVWQSPLLTPPNPGGWCEAYLDMEGETRWRWGSDYPQSVYPFDPLHAVNDFLEFMQQQSPFIYDTPLLKLLGLKDWPAGDERWVRMHEPE